MHLSDPDAGGHRWVIITTDPPDVMVLSPSEAAALAHRLAEVLAR